MNTGIRLFVPTPQQTNWLLVVGFLSFGEAFYLRYQAIEHAQVSLACQAGLNTWLCATRAVAINLFMHWVFGWTAVAAALLNLIRPSMALFSFTLLVTAFGLVLHNTGLSALAAALMILSLARPAAVTE